MAKWWKNLCCRFGFHDWVSYSSYTECSNCNESIDEHDLGDW